MDGAKTWFGHTAQDFKIEHAHARAGLIKAEQASKSGSDFVGRKVEVMTSGTKHTLDSSEAFTSQTKKKTLA